MCFCLFSGPWAPCARPFSCFLSSLPVLLIICAPVPHCVSVFLAILSSSCACSLPVEHCLLACLPAHLNSSPVCYPVFLVWPQSTPGLLLRTVIWFINLFGQLSCACVFFPVFWWDWRFFCATCWATCWARVLFCLNKLFKLNLLSGQILITNMTIVGFYLKQSSKICRWIYIWHLVDFWLKRLPCLSSVNSCIWSVNSLYIASIMHFKLLCSICLGEASSIY